MSILKVRKYGEPILRKKAKAVEKITPELQRLIKDMFETMYAAPGCGLAASQVGVPLRLCVIDCMPQGESQPIVLINPKIVGKGKKLVLEEGCLSFPGIMVNVPRYDKVRVQSLNHQGIPIIIESGGFLAQAVQHEMDHMDGKLLLDKLSFFRKTKLKGIIRQRKKAGTW